MNKTTEALKVAEIEDLQDSVTKALKKAFQLGQTYWQQADSESFSQNKKADETQAKFYELEDETVAAIREALADHSGDDNEMVADTNPLSVFAKECSLGAYTPDEMVDAARLALRRAKGLAEPVKQEPVVCQDSDDRRLLREIFMLCEATEEIEATNDFMRGRVFEAKGIRRGIGTWYQDTFCGRSYMGEPVIPAAPVQPVKQEPVAYMVKSEGFIYSLVNRISAAEEIVSMLRKDDQGAAIHPLYAAPVQQVDLTDEELEALYDRHAGGWRVLFRAVIAAYKEKNK